MLKQDVRFYLIRACLCKPDVVPSYQDSMSIYEAQESNLLSYVSMAYALKGALDLEALTAKAFRA